MNEIVYVIDRGDINQRLMVYCTDYITLLLVLCLEVYNFCMYTYITIVYKIIFFSKFQIALIYYREFFKWNLK